MKQLKNIKTFENFQEYDTPPQFLENIEQNIVTVGDTTYSKFLETEDFIYFTVKDDDDCLMYRKPDLELVSDNYMAQDDLFGRLLDKDWTWASDAAKLAANELEKDNNN